MSNLYAIDAGAADIAAHFHTLNIPDPTWAATIRPGDPGLIVRHSPRMNGLVAQTYKYGFPRYDRENLDAAPTPVNLVADLTNPMWEDVVVDPKYRCFVVASRFANPAGAKGRKTRTWFSVRNMPIIAFAGFCLGTDEWGPVYAVMTGKANDLVMPYNDRMAIILTPADYQRWLTGPIGDVISYQHQRPPFPASRMILQHTEELWVPRGQRAIRPKPEEGPLLV